MSAIQRRPLRMPAGIFDQRLAVHHHHAVREKMWAGATIVLLILAIAAQAVAPIFTLATLGTITAGVIAAWHGERRKEAER